MPAPPVVSPGDALLKSLRPKVLLRKVFPDGSAKWYMSNRVIIEADMRDGPDGFRVAAWPEAAGEPREETTEITNSFKKRPAAADSVMAPVAPETFWFTAMVYKRPSGNNVGVRHRFGDKRQCFQAKAPATLSEAELKVIGKQICVDMSDGMPEDDAKERLVTLLELAE